MAKHCVASDVSLETSNGTDRLLTPHTLTYICSHCGKIKSTYWFDPPQAAAVCECRCDEQPHSINQEACLKHIARIREHLQHVTAFTCARRDTSQEAEALYDESMETWDVLTALSTLLGGEE